MGITAQVGDPYDHTHPGKCERVHQTCLYSARAMLSASNLPVQYYSDAILMASYLYNRTIHGSDKKTPYEHMFGSPPTWGHLRPFGCIGYAFIPPEKRTDLEPSRTRCRLL